MGYSSDIDLQRNCMDKKWLNLKVLYVRMSSCPLKKSPKYLSMHLIPKDFSVGLEVNGEHIAPSEIGSSVLQRDRIDEKCEEVTYVSTDSVKTTGPLRFKVYHKDVLLVCGKLERLDSGVEDFVKDKELGWRMDCYAEFGLVDWVLLRRNIELRPWNHLAPVMEVYFAGCSLERPVIFTKRLQLVCMRNGAGRPCLDVIPEDEEIAKHSKSRAKSDPSFQITDCIDSEDLDENVRPTFSEFDPGSEYIEEEDGELSWFNAGVSVGVGIGLGMCLAVGVGVGLLVRTYQTATKTARRRWL
ncbi:hypothetical protein KI387_026193 [Taxus chinensis]|uniref:Uncharacterized protein n=1 Tax=Taxus chinensis TaxID=29808 RepID=A0AA38FXZ6_TAXCH|nr:hypothetical protein KI387_026193 [Taxus chinensis]